MTKAEFEALARFRARREQGIRMQAGDEFGRTASALRVRLAKLGQNATAGSSEKP